VGEPVLQVGEWLLDAERNEVRRGEEAVRLEPKAVEVLRQLALRPGRVLSREELLSSVWPGVIVGDDALTQAIIKLRKALGDDAQQPRYIETIPKRGYRLVAAVTSAEAPPASAPSPPRHTRGPLIAAAIGIVVALGVGLGLWVADKPWPLRPDRKESGPAASLPLIAVLPLVNLSGDPARDYLSDGLSADIIDALGRFSGLRVMSWNAVQQFRDGEATPGGVRSALSARYVVRGSVREADGTLRVSVELSDAEKGLQLWSDRYDGRGAQLFEIQDRMVRSIVGALAVKLRDIEQKRAFAQPTESSEAYDLVLRARALMRLEQRRPNREAKELLVRAQKLAPDYAEVWVALGENEWNRAAFGWIEDPEEGIRRAEALARRAVELSDAGARARAYALLATLKTHAGHAEEGLAHAARALEINPSDASSLFRQGHALLALGRAEDAIATFEYAMRLEPNPSVGPQSQLATAYYLAGRYRDAVRYADVVIALRPDFASIRAVRAAALAQLGQLDEARESAEVARRLNPRLNIEEAGSRFRRPEDAAKLREGLAKAGL
jgi:TolB-like protein/DNA-binding winged helix-turn-helix (wHTH) protein